VVLCIFPALTISQIDSQIGSEVVSHPNLELTDTDPENLVSCGMECGSEGVKAETAKFPFAIVWSPLPPITWILPFIGHTGIATSEGVIYDFAGPYTINRDNMAFGAPTRYLQLSPSQCDGLDWDSSVEEGCSVYSQRMHNLCFDNCHSHVARCLNAMGYRKYKGYTMLHIGIACFFGARFVSFGAFVKTYLPFTIFLVIFLYFNGNLG
jgi:transmembrane protein 222